MKAMTLAVTVGDAPDKLAPASDSRPSNAPPRTTMPATIAIIISARCRDQVRHEPWGRGWAAVVGCASVVSVLNAVIVLSGFVVVRGRRYIPPGGFVVRGLTR